MNDARTKYDDEIQFKCHSDQKAELKRLADSCGLSLSEYQRAISNAAISKNLTFAKKVSTNIVGA